MAVLKQRSYRIPALLGNTPLARLLSTADCRLQTAGLGSDKSVPWFPEHHKLRFVYAFIPSPMLCSRRFVSGLDERNASTRDLSFTSRYQLVPNQSRPAFAMLVSSPEFNANRATGVVYRTVRIILAFLLVMVGLSHQPPLGVGDMVTLDVAAYVLPDGTLPELCVTTDDGEVPHYGAATICEACLIASSAMLPTPVDVVGRRIVIALDMTVPSLSDKGYRRLFSANTAPRAPPVPDSV